MLKVTVSRYSHDECSILIFQHRNCKVQQFGGHFIDRSAIKSGNLRQYNQVVIFLSLAQYLALGV